MIIIPGTIYAPAVFGNPATNAPQPFNPGQLFGGGETGDWWSVADISTLFQDSAGATPVAASGDPVGRIVGKTNSNALVQGTSARKGIYTVSGGLKYIIFDGADDGIGAAFTMGATFTRIMIGQQVSWTIGHSIWDGVSTNKARVYQNGTTPRLTFYSGSGLLTNPDMTIGANHVLTELWNGVSSQAAIDNNSYTTGNTGTATADGLTVGASDTGGTSAANIWWFGGVMISRILTSQEIANCRTYFGALAGLSL